MPRTFRAGTYWIRFDLGGDLNKNHPLYSGLPEGVQSSSFNQIKRSDLPDDAVIYDMVANGSDEHWAEFGEHIYAGEVVHLVSERSVRKRKNTSDDDAQPDGKCGKDPSKPTTLLFLEQQLEAKFWDWSNADPDMKAAFEDALKRRDVVRIGCLIVTKLGLEGIVFSDFHIVLHDADVDDCIWDDARETYRTVKKVDHIHAVGRYAKPTDGVSPNRIAQILGIQASQVEIPKSKKYAYDNKMAYLIHFKHPQKHQYDPAQVVTLAGCSYKKYMMEHLHGWEIGRAKKIAEVEDTTVDVDWLWEECFAGRVTRQNIELTDRYRRCYALHRRKIDEALDSYARKCMSELVDKFDKGVFKTSFVYIQGPSRMGKSFLAACVCDALCYRFGWKVDDLASANSMDDYRGGDVILIDDASVSAMSGKAWLNLIDPNHAHPAPSRFKNKPRIAPRVVIITSTKDPIEFFFYARELGGDRNEAMTQFLARIMRTAVVFDWRDCWGTFSTQLPNGAVFDPSFYNVSVQAPQMLPAPYFIQVGNSQTTVKIETGLFPLVDGNNVPLSFSPIGAMVQLVLDLEARNDDVEPNGDYDDLRRMMGDKYRAAIQDNCAKRNDNNLMLPANFEVLPDSIPVVATPVERKRLAAAEKQRRLNEAAQKRLMESTQAEAEERQRQEQQCLAKEEKKKEIRDRIACYARMEENGLYLTPEQERYLFLYKKGA